MPSSSAIRLQVEAALAHRIPSALSPMPRGVRPVAPTGVAAVDGMLEGGLPIGAISELVGPQSSGRTSLALSFVAGATRAGNVGAWVDVSDELDPESAAAAGVELARLLWVRCGGGGRGRAGAEARLAESDFALTDVIGTTESRALLQSKVPERGSIQGAVPSSISGPRPAEEAEQFRLPEKYLIPPPVKKGLHGGGFGPHPRTEVKGLSAAVSKLLRPEAIAARRAEPHPRPEPGREAVAPVSPHLTAKANAHLRPVKPWTRIEQALRVTDLLLQAGGFAAIVLDMSGIAAEYATRVPLATWFRYRAAAERAQTSLLLLTQHPCAKSSGELLLQFHAGRPCGDETTVFTGIEHSVEVVRRRFTQAPVNVVSIRKPPQRETGAHWRTRSTWAGAR